MNCQISCKKSSKKNKAFLLTTSVTFYLRQFVPFSLLDLDASFIYSAFF